MHHFQTYGFGNTLDLNEAHAAIASHGQSLVVAEARDLNSCLLASLVNRVGSINLYV